MTDGARRDVEQMLVHNLKAPLTGLLATLEMLEDGDFGALAPGQREAVVTMRAQGGALLGLVDELLDVWRAESLAGLTVTPSAVDLCALGAEVATEWAPRFHGRLVLDGPETLSVLVDPDVLRRVLANLLLNAVVHGGDGVSARLVLTSSETVAQADVSDTGPGVPPDERERIFESWVTVPRGPRPHRGSGLGLAYCRAAMEAMGGSVTVAPADRGATFRLTMPLGPTEAGA